MIGGDQIARLTKCYVAAVAGSDRSLGHSVGADLGVKHRASDPSSETRGESEPSIETLRSTDRAMKQERSMLWAETAMLQQILTLRYACRGRIRKVRRRA